MTSFALVGDLMVGRGVDSALTADAGDLVFSDLLPWLRTADVSFGNLESPVTDDLSSAKAAHSDEPSYYLCAPAGNLQILADAGFDILSTANNHRSDCLSKKTDGTGEVETVRQIMNHGMQAVDSSFKPVLFNANGLRMAFLAADDVLEPIDLQRLILAVQDARKTGAVVIVSIHWGLEYQAGASRRQQDTAGRLAEAGARLIIGHHPHVIQPVECIAAKNGHEPALVFYSLGNALFDQHGLPDTRKGMLAYVRLSESGPIFYEQMKFLIKAGDGFRLDLEQEAEQELAGVCR